MSFRRPNMFMLDPFFLVGSCYKNPHGMLTALVLKLLNLKCDVLTIPNYYHFYPKSVKKA